MNAHMYKKSMARCLMGYCWGFFQVLYTEGWNCSCCYGCCCWVLTLLSLHLVPGHAHSNLSSLSSRIKFCFWLEGCQVKRLNSISSRLGWFGSVLIFLHHSLLMFSRLACWRILPADHKRLIIYPNLKKPSLHPDDMASYRPISNLSLTSKLLERSAVHAQILIYLTENGLLPSVQSAYIQFSLTETAVPKVVTDVLTAIMDRWQITLLGMFDLSAAFDTVDHVIPLKRLEVSFGIPCAALNWFASHLSGTYEPASSCSWQTGSVNISRIWRASVIVTRTGFLSFVYCRPV